MRNLLLFLGSAAVLGALFWGYTRLSPAPPPGEAADERDARPLPTNADPADDKLVIEPHGQTGKRSPLTTDVQLSPGQRLEIVVYDPHTHRPMMLVRGAQFAPVPNLKDALAVEEPDLSLLLPSGLVARISSARGNIVLDQAGSKLNGVRRGTLQGPARLTLSRSEDVNAATQPAADAPAEPQITVDLDETLEFDVDLGFIKTKGAIHAAAAQFDLRGRELELLWNRAENRIEKLSMAPGGTLTLAGGMPGELAGEKPTSSAPTTAASKPAPPTAGTVYEIALDGPVVAQQMRGDEEVGRLDAERLHLTFDVGSRGRAALGGPAEKGSASAPTTAPTTTNPAVASDRPRKPASDKSPSTQPREERLVVTWKGALHLTPIGKTARARREQSIEAFGAPVRWTSRQISIRGSRLEYDGTAQRLWIDPLPGEGVEVDLSTTAHLTAAGVYVDRAADLVKLVGPLRLWSRDKSKRSESLVITCGLWGTLNLAASKNPASQPTGTDLSSFGELERATFVGDVHVEMSGRVLDADRLETSFRAPEGNEPLEARLDSSEASGGVRLKAGEQRMTCDQLSINYSRDEQGEIFPRSVQGRGAVSLSDRGGKVAASGRAVNALLDRRDQVRHARIVGTPTHWASASAAPFRVRGEVIELEPEDERLDVHGPSRVSFLAQRSLRGADRGRPLPVVVTSRQSLRVDGKANAITLTGDVQARTGDETLYAEGLTILLEDADGGAPAPSSERDISPLAFARGLALVQAPLSRVPGTLQSLWQSYSGRDRREVEVGRDSRRRAERKEPTRLLARQARVRSVTLAPGDSSPLVDQQISAPEMEVDIRNRTIHTTGLTTLEMIDLRLPGEDGSQNSGDALGLPSALVSRGPSHTAMVCTRGMLYRVGQEGTERRDGVVFEGSVRFVHLTGREIADLDTLLPELAGDPQRLAKLKSRNFRTWCDRLECVFVGDNQTTGRGLAADGLRLESLIASGETYVRDQIGAGIREIWARHVEFDRPNATVRVRGAEDGSSNARVDYSNTASQRMETIAQGPDFVIDLNNNTVRAGPTTGGGVRP